jgi:hypothetical protein
MVSTLVRIGTLATLAGLLTWTAPAATHTAPSVNYNDVKAKLDLCVNGDRLVIPAGSATWTQELTVNVAISIEGAGMYLTTLVHGFPYTGTNPYYRPLIKAGGSGVARISGIGFDGMYAQGGQGISVVGQFWRIDNCYFYRCQDRGVIGWVPIGLVDHCIFKDCWSDVTFEADQFNAWTRPLGIGTTNCWVVEDCYGFRTGNYYTQVIADAGWGARYTFRFNVFSNIGASSIDYALDAHGNQGSPFGSGSSIAGTVFLESYNNLWSLGNANRIAILRGGTQIHYNNTTTASGGNILNFNNTFILSEEDGYRYGSPIRTNWPGYHQITNSYFFNNTLNGSAANPKLEFPGTTPCTTNTGCGAPWPSDGIFMQEDRDYFVFQPSSSFYKPLKYPHPRIILENNPPIPPAFALSSPAHGATGVSIQPTLSWSDTSGETGYRVFVATNIFFATPVVDQTLAANTTSYAIPAGKLSTSRTYYWRVWANSANGLNSNSGEDPSSFTTGSGTVVPGSIQLSAATYSFNEDAGTGTITFKRVAGSDQAVTIDYAMSDGTAQNAVNYNQISGTVSWANGDSADKTRTVTLIDDGVYASDKTCTITLSNPTGGATLGSPASAVVTIVNTDLPPSDPPLMPGLVAYAHEGLITAPGLTNASGWWYHTIETDDPAAGGSVSWRFNVSEDDYRFLVELNAMGTDRNSFFFKVDGNPVAPGDVWPVMVLTGSGLEERYVARLGSGTSQPEFPTNVVHLTSGIHTVKVVGRELNAYLYKLTLESVASPPPQVVAWAELGAQGQEGEGASITFVIERRNGSSGAISVLYATQDGTAKAGTDYTATSGTANFGDGVTTVSFQVPLLNDQFYTGDREFQVVLSSPSGAQISGDSSVIGRVTDDDTRSKRIPRPKKTSVGSVVVK